MCVRKASIYRSLGVSERYVAESDCNTCYNMIGGFLRLFLQESWHHLIGWNILIFKVTHISNWLDHLCHCLHAPMSSLTCTDVIAYTCWCVTCVIAYTNQITYVIAYMCRCVIDILHALYVFISWNLANFVIFWMVMV